jgi:AraC-like DNA-binding protein
MNQMADILTLDVTERAPLLPGDHFIGVSDARAGADIVDTRYLSKTRNARTLSARFGDDFGLIINDGLWGATSPFEAAFYGNGAYILSMRLSGNCLESVNRNRYSLGPCSCSLIHYAPGVKHVFRITSAEPLVEVCAVFRASFFAKKYNMSEIEAQSLLNPPPHRKLDPWFNRCRMTPELEAAVHELRGASPFCKTWRLFAEAKTLELVALYLEQLQGLDQKRRQLPVTVHDRQRLYLARDYLSRHYREAPRIAELCRLAGLNRRKLTAGFKAEFGRTVYDYIQYRRMEQARALFQNGFTDVGQVALHVGYTYQGNFTKAFKQYLGLSPRQFLAAQQLTYKARKVPIASIR